VQHRWLNQLDRARITEPNLLAHREFLRRNGKSDRGPLFLAAVWALQDRSLVAPVREAGIVEFLGPYDSRDVRERETHLAYSFTQANRRGSLTFVLDKTDCLKLSAFGGWAPATAVTSKSATRD